MKKIITTWTVHFTVKPR